MAYVLSLCGCTLVKYSTDLQIYLVIYHTCILKLIIYISFTLYILIVY